MRRVIDKNGRAALIVLASVLAAVGSRARADAPVPAEAVAASVAAPAEPVPAEPAPAEARDRLMEIVVQYLDVAFVREIRESRTAALQAPTAASLQ